MLDEFTQVRREIKSGQELLLREIHTNCELIGKESKRLNEMETRVQRNKVLQESLGSDFRESMERVSEDMRRVWTELKLKSDRKPVEKIATDLESLARDIQGR